MVVCNPIAEYAGTTPSKSYTWGMDLSGSMRGAGGVGGLLSVNDGSATYYPTFDGNGNVSEYVDATGSVVAHYEYDAFGQVVASGVKANDFTHQFSTKQLDAESSLHYYGYRYYDAGNGRFVSRDPAGDRAFLIVYFKTCNETGSASQQCKAKFYELTEEGRMCLYVFVSNSPIRSIDELGLLLSPTLPSELGKKVGCCSKRLCKADCVAANVACSIICAAKRWSDPDNEGVDLCWLRCDAGERDCKKGL